MSTSWGGWGTKLNVTSIVSQGLEQVRSLREDVEKSFDQVVTGAPGALPLGSRASHNGGLVEYKAGDNEANQTPNEAAVDLNEDKSSAEVDTITTEVGTIAAEETTELIQEEKVVSQAELEEKLELKEEEKEEKEDAIEEQEEAELEQEQQEEQEQEQVEGQEQVEEEVEKQVEAETDSAVAVLEHVEVLEEPEESAEQEEVVPEKSDDVAEESELDVATLRKELEVRESQLLATSTTIRELHDELDKTCHREVAAVERAQFLTEQLENMRREVTKLTQLHRDTSNSQSADVQALQMALAEKEEKLSGLLDEGQALSVKQAQLEQRLRTLRKEKDELEERALKSQSQFEASAEEVKDLSAKLKASEEEKTRLAQENRELASSADGTTAKAEKAEREALEAAQQLAKLQAQVQELTLEVSNKDDEIGRLKTATQSNEALNLEKSELEQTLQFFQENVRDLEQEAARREEMARAEIADLKRKWQDAVGRVDMLGQSISEATQPLLRQIHALQEDQRARQENWKATESTLVARIDEAAEQRRAAEQEKLDMEQQLHELQLKVDDIELELTRKQAELARAQETVEVVKAEARELRGQVDALHIDLAQAKHQRDAEAEAKQQLQARLDGVEKSAKKVEASETATAELEQSREREAQLQQDLEWHRQELLRLKSSTAQPTPAPLSTGSTSSQHYYARRNIDGEQHNGSESLSSEASILKTTLETTMTDSLSSNGGNTSILGLNQLQQRLRLREGENRMLKQQLEALEARQKQTTDEIVRLSTRNALLETGEAQREQAQLELAKVQKHQVVLLELFGEKEEQVEELQAEVSELKAFYRKQLDTLATQNEQQKQRAEQQHH